MAGARSGAAAGFVAVALLSLTLGIGATSAIFSVIYGVIIDPYPYAAADHIWMPDVNGRRRPRRAHLHRRRGAAAAGVAGVRVGDGHLGPARAADRRVRAREPDGRAGHGERVQLPRRAARGRPHHPALGPPRQRRRRAGRGLEPPPVAAAVRRQPGRGRADAAAERPSAHDRRCDAAPVRLVDERWPLAAAGADPDRRAVGQPDRPAGARRHRGGRGRAAARDQPPVRRGAARHLPEAGLHDAACATTWTSRSPAARCAPACASCSARSASCC